MTVNMANKTQAKNIAFAPMKQANARMAFYAWILSGGLLFGARGWESFLTLQAAAFFIVGAFFSVHVIAQANFFIQRGAAVAMQSVIGQKSDQGARFINGFGIGLLAGGPAMAWFAANAAMPFLFGG